MGRRREPLIFVLTVAGAAALLVSIAIAELLLVTAMVVWVVWQPRSPRLPSYFIPMCGFIAATLVSLGLSPDPAVNWGLRKTFLFTMAILAPTFVTTTNRARTAVATLTAVASVTSAYGLVQFLIKYLRFTTTQQLGDDPTILARITGFMGHWMTFSGEQLLVWCAATPALLSIVEGEPA